MARKEDGYDKLKKDISSKCPARLYVFYGEETYLKAHYLNLLRELIVPDGLEDFNYTLLEGKGLTVQQIADAAAFYPVMAERRLIVVRDYPVMKPGAADTEPLADLFSGLTDDICLVFVYDTLEYKQDKRNKACAAAEMNGTAVQFSKSKPADLMPWIKRRFVAHGKEISTPDCEFLIHYSGALMHVLISEIEKIAAFSKRPVISRAEIEAVAVKTLDAAVFNLTDAITAGRGSQAMHLLRELSGMGYEPVVLTASICKQIQRLYSAGLCLKAGKGSAFIMDLWDMRSSYPAEKLLSAAARYPVAALREAVILCGNADMEQKCLPGDRMQMLELLMLTLLTKLKEAAV